MPGRALLASPPVTTTRRPVRGLVLAGAAGLVLALAACSETERLELGTAAPLEASDPLGVDFAVLSVTESTEEESGLTGMFDTELNGNPWLVGYRLDLTSGTREDFSWDAVTDLSNAAWTATTDKTDFQASGPGGSAAAEIPCPEQGAEVVEPVLMYGCQVFVIPEGQQIQSITVEDVATWAVEE